MASFFPFDALQENKILTQDIQLSKPFIQVFPTKKSKNYNYIMFTSAGLSFGYWDRLRRDDTEHDHPICTMNLKVLRYSTL